MVRLRNLPELCNMLNWLGSNLEVLLYGFVKMHNKMLAGLGLHLQAGSISFSTCAHFEHKWRNLNFPHRPSNSISFSKGSSIPTNPVPYTRLQQRKADEGC